MDLTPIRPRGARNWHKRSSLVPNLGQRRKRRRDGDAVKGSSQQSNSAQAKTARPGPRLSRIEQLPLEILESIFTYAPNVSLPLCNGGLGSALANEKMYMEVAAAWFISNPIVDAEDSLSQMDMEAINQANQILAARWMTWSRFKRILGGIVARIHASTPSNADGDDQSSHSPNFDRPHLQQAFNNLRLGTELQIPSKLLHGPWSDEKSSFLYYLCFLGLRVDWDRSTAGELACAGLEEAIKARDRRAVISLLSDYILVLPTMETLRGAVINHGCDQTIVFHLLLACIRAKAREIDGLAPYGTLKANPLDSIIWAWLKRFEADGNAKAAWLKVALKTAGSLFRDTAASMSEKHHEFESRCGLPEHGVESIPVPTDQIL